MPLCDTQQPAFAEDGAFQGRRARSLVELVAPFDDQVERPVDECMEFEPELRGERGGARHRVVDEDEQVPVASDARLVTDRRSEEDDGDHAFAGGDRGNRPVEPTGSVECVRVGADEAERGIHASMLLPPESGVNARLGVTDPRPARRPPDPSTRSPHRARRRLSPSADAASKEWG